MNGNRRENVMAETNRPLKLDNAFVRHRCPARTYSLVMVSYYPRHIYWSNIIVCSTRDMDLNQELNQSVTDGRTDGQG